MLEDLIRYCFSLFVLFASTCVYILPPLLPILSKTLKTKCPVRQKGEMHKSVFMLAGVRQRAVVFVD